MSLTRWLMREHPFFQQLREHLGTVLASRSIASFDDLVVVSRRPARTVLLMLNDMIGQSTASVSTTGIVGGTEPYTARLPSIRRWTAPEPWGKIERRYVQAQADRDPPALLWGQRWLTPESAVERAHYILSWLPQTRGRAVFLGDDDMVSPLLAALAPGWIVHVADIDRAVLEGVRRVAESLGARITTHHADLSQVPLELTNRCDIVVSDPNPSADGSSESVFWSQAAMLLPPGAISITTSSPSHKPVHYGAGALRELARRDFHILDLRTDYGRYELFDFDLLPAERKMLDAHRLRCHIHHTKSLTAALRGTQNAAPVPSEFDFDRWSRAARNHYLTLQADAEEQEQIVRRRGAATLPHASNELSASVRRGFRLDLVAVELTPVMLEMANGTEAVRVEDAATRILRSMGADPERQEVLELLRLSIGGEITGSGPLAPLGLAFRALDSWERRLLHA